MPKTFAKNKFWSIWLMSKQLNFLGYFGKGVFSSQNGKDSRIVWLFCENVLFLWLKNRNYRTLFSQEPLSVISNKSFANYYHIANWMKIRQIRSSRPRITRHPTMHNRSVCEKPFHEVAKFCEISVLRLKESSDLYQTVYLKSCFRDCCRSLSFGWVWQLVMFRGLFFAVRVL